MWLIEDIYGYFKAGHIYGKSGDKVTLIAEHGNVMIVEGSDKIRFPVHTNKVSDSLPTKIEDNKKADNQVQARKTKTTRPAPKIQPNLFL